MPGMVGVTVAASDVLLGRGVVVGVAVWVGVNVAVVGGTGPQSMLVLRVVTETSLICNWPVSSRWKRIYCARVPMGKVMVWFSASEESQVPTISLHLT